MKCLAMYDKIKFWLPNYSIVGEYSSTIANYLDRGKEETDIETGEVRLSGNLDNLKIFESARGLTITGSLPKYLFGDNIRTLDKHSTRRAIEKISDALHTDVSRASVTEFEFGANFPVRHLVQEYLAKMGEMPRLCKYHFNPSSLYYQGRGRVKPKKFVFYDKLADAKEKGMTFPEMNGFNLLRYEMRFSGRIPQQMNVPEVLATTLYDPQFYRLAVKRYQDSYFSISKIEQLKIDFMSEIKTVKNAVDVFCCGLIRQSAPGMIEEFIAELKRQKVFNDKNNYSRLKRKIQELKSKADFTTTDELIRELDDDIKNVGAYV